MRRGWRCHESSFRVAAVRPRARAYYNSTAQDCRRRLLREKVTPSARSSADVDFSEAGGMGMASFLVAAVALRSTAPSSEGPGPLGPLASTTNNAFDGAALQPTCSPACPDTSPLAAWGLLSGAQAGNRVHEASAALPPRMGDQWVARVKVTDGLPAGNAMASECDSGASAWRCATERQQALPMQGRGETSNRDSRRRSATPVTKVIVWSYCPSAAPPAAG
ncbi:hypothetical protein Micbo1qcDRAFT_172049 [Microdochium bolleyi]|uniref:Uncharacterized protein n=1 Tax=Microdochium bolleyi TaxID=196109 RepID=A0A136JEY5_9PEZI|nr:hypothetical protein Micbo1qcDRAFT_172049 [Microdochium bolleyi]